MQQMQIGAINLLEGATLTATSELSDAPAWLLCDRIFSRPWTAASAADQTLKAHLATAQAFNRLVIPAGHNLAGATISWEESDADAGYAAVVPPWVVPAGLALIEKAGAATKLWQKVTISGAAQAPKAGELFLTDVKTYRAPDFGSRVRKVSTVSRVQLRGGAPHFVKWGASVRSFVYEIPAGANADRSNFETWFDAWDGCKPFFMVDHQGNAFFAELLEPPDFVEKDFGSFSLSLKIQQVH